VFEHVRGEPNISLGTNAGTQVGRRGNESRDEAECVTLRPAATSPIAPVPAGNRREINHPYRSELDEQRRGGKVDLPVERQCAEAHGRLKRWVSDD
jgi:hypothetical protein